MYFSFFGGVKAPGAGHPLRYQHCATQHGRLCGCQDLCVDLDTCPTAERATCDYCAWQPPWGWEQAASRELWRQEASGITATAYPLAEDPEQQVTLAWLVVACPGGEWVEEGIVYWPLRFTAPAAVAGACCQPRYGLAAVEEPECP
jgi:hypothetical protein